MIPVFFYILPEVLCFCPASVRAIVLHAGAGGVYRLPPENRDRRGER